MKRSDLFGFLCGLCLASLLFIAGCNTATRPTPEKPVRPDASNVAGRHEAKDKTVNVEADKIDSTVKGTPQAAEVRASTDAQRAAVAAAPAKEIVELAANFNRALDLVEKRAAALEADNVSLNKRLGELTDAERKKQILILRGLGIVCAVAAGALIYFGQRSFSGLAGIISVILLGLAQLISQPWFDLAFNIALGLAFLAFLGVGIYEFRQKLRAKRLSTAHDDVIAGVEEVRALFRNPTAELAEIVRNAHTPEEAIEAVRKLGKALNAKMAEYVTEADGTAALIDERRRALKLLS